MSKLKLQTVYTLVKPGEDINTGICVKYKHTGHKFPVKEQKGIFFTQEEYNTKIKEIIGQTLILSAEKAVLTYKDDNGFCFVAKKEYI